MRRAEPVYVCGGEAALANRRVPEAHGLPRATVRGQPHLRGSQGSRAPLSVCLCACPAGGYWLHRWCELSRRCSVQLLRPVEQWLFGVFRHLSLPLLPTARSAPQCGQMPHMSAETDLPVCSACAPWGPRAPARPSVSTPGAPVFVFVSALLHRFRSRLPLAVDRQGEIRSRTLSIQASRDRIDLCSQWCELIKTPRRGARDAARAV